MALDVETLLSTNYPPSDVEAQHIHATLHVGEMELEELDTQISKVALLLAELQAQRKQRHQSLTSLRAVLSPLRRFPAEILAEIFQSCCQNSRATPFYSITEPLEAPMLLGRICSFWRTVAYNTPRLWNTIHFYTNFPRTDRLAPYVSSLAERSRNLPLSVTINTLPPRPNLPLPLPGAPVDIIGNLCHRLQELRLILDDDDSDFPAMITADTTFPILTSLVVKIQTNPDTDILAADLGEIVDVFSQTASLRHLTLEALEFTGNSLSTVLLWERLTFLDLNVIMDLFEARSILTHCSQLTRCKMPNVRPADDEEPDLPMCVLTTLSSFEFGAWEYGITSPFFQPFSFPNLRFLTIEAGAWPDNLLLDLHARSGFNLTRLSLVNLELGADALITFLRLVPSLTVLFLRNADCVTNRLFEAFTCDASSKSTEITLPLLQLLMLQQFVNHLEGETVVRMVESLWGHRDTADAAFPSLRRIQFAMIGSRFSDDVESRLAKICATGFLNDFYKRSAPV